MKAYLYHRISSAGQQSGHGLERQAELTESYATRMNFDIQEQDFTDIASGYHGDHMSGKLGVFLEAIRSKEIETPAVLVVESLDRLGREHTMLALPRFIDIINLDVEIHEVSTGVVYNKHETHKLHIAIAIMERAHNESKMKSDRAKAVARAKLEKAQTDPTVKVSNNYPCWLTHTENGFEVIPDRVRVIQKIFNLYVQGKGSNAIAQQLRKDKDVYFTSNMLSKKLRSHTWTDQRVLHVIKNETVTGVFTSTVDTSVVIDDYYPVVVEKAVFQEAQEIRKSRTKTRAKSVDGLNLFSGLLKCSHCGSSLQYNKSYSDKKKTHCYETVRCRDRAAKQGCDSKAVDLRKLERLIVGWVGMIPIKDINADLTNKRTILEAEINAKEKQADNLVELLAGGHKRIQQKYEDLEKQIAELKEELDKTPIQHKTERVDFFKVLDLSETEYRTKIQQEMLRLFEYIQVWCDGKDVQVDVKLKVDSIHNHQSFVGTKKDLDKARMKYRIMRPAV